MPVFTGDAAEASAVCFSMPSNDVMAYIGESMNKYIGAMGHLSSSITDRVMQQYQEFNTNTLGRTATAIRHKINNFWKGDSIRVLPTIGDIQQAPQSMVRWAMANPEIRGYYHSGRIEGYGDEYIDREQTLSGRNHYDYRRVMDGTATFRPVKDAEDCDVMASSYTNYYDKLLDRDVVLSNLDKISIQTVWEIANGSLEDGDGSDPTSRWNGLIS